MTQLSKKLASLLTKTVADVREIGAEAFRTGDDELVREAQSVVRLITDLVADPGTVKSEKGARATSKRRSSPPSKGTRMGAARKYPKFVGDRGALARVGWSKKDKREYRHKVTRSVFEGAIEAMVAARDRTGAPVLAERIVEKAMIGEDQIPAYQTYVVIGFLKDRGVIKQMGRQGYVIPERIKTAADAEWKSTIGG